MTGAPAQPTRRARTKARDMAATLKRMARADERPFYQVVGAAGMHRNSVDQWPEHALPTLTAAMALADAVGYEIVLRRKE